MSNTVWTAWWADAGIAAAATATPITALTSSRLMDLWTRHDTINFCDSGCSAISDQKQYEFSSGYDFGYDILGNHVFHKPPARTHNARLAVRKFSSSLNRPPLTKSKRYANPVERPSG